MPICNLNEVKKLLKPRQRLLGLDVGTKTIGLALSDTGLMIGSPHSTIARTKFTKDFEILEKIIEEMGVGGLIIGLPVNMDGTDGPKCQSVRSLGNNILEKRDMPIAFWDERLSTVAAEKAMLEGDMTRAKRQKRIDKIAATIILQGALDMIGF
ncbi:MAG: Holliday junction resolvase RuvX [Alphaproteobacteria bacterium]